MECVSGAHDHGPGRHAGKRSSLRVPRSEGIPLGKTTPRRRGSRCLTRWSDAPVSRPSYATRVVRSVSSRATRRMSADRAVSHDVEEAVIRQDAARQKSDCGGDGKSGSGAKTTIRCLRLGLVGGIARASILASRVKAALNAGTGPSIVLVVFNNARRVASRAPGRSAVLQLTPAEPRHGDAEYCPSGNRMSSRPQPGSRHWAHIGRARRSTSARSPRVASQPRVQLRNPHRMASAIAAQSLDVQFHRINRFGAGSRAPSSCRWRR
jgi:hypothetical protein